MLYLLILGLVALVLPWQCEGSIKAALSRTVAFGATWRGLRLVGVALPYRPNRCYYRLSLGRV